jgi:hypothetical protein
MRKVLWMIILFGAYVWVMTSGHDQMLISQGKKIFQAFVSWFDDAEVDFQTKNESKSKKKSRRWD